MNGKIVDGAQGIAPREREREREGGREGETDRERERARETGRAKQTQEQRTKMTQRRCHPSKCVWMLLHVGGGGTSQERFLSKFGGVVKRVRYSFKSGP